MRFPLSPLLVGRTHRDLADRLGVELATVRQWAHRGLSVYQADRIAVRLGRHPAEVWDDWWHVPAGDGLDRRERHAAYMRLYRAWKAAA